MPSSVTIPCQIKSKGQDGGFINGLANYTIEPGTFKTFHYGFYKKQVSLFLYDLQVGDNALLCGKCVFNRGIMYILVSAAFKLPTIKNIEAGPYVSFVGTIYEGIEKNENDCKFGINLLEYNGFNFANKERMTFKIQVVYEAGPTSRFNKIASRLQIGKIVFISGFFDLNENELPFVEAKEIDLLNDFNNSLEIQPTNINLQSPFSRTHKFKGNRDTAESSNKQNNNDNNDDRLGNIIIKKEKNAVPLTSSTSSVMDNQLISEQPKKANNKRKKDLVHLPIQRRTKLKVQTRSQTQTEDDNPEENVEM